MKRLRYWWEKINAERWQWGHPDEWSDAEWFYYDKEKRK